MLIGFSGLKLSGKDTAGDYLATEYGFTKTSFATKLKQALEAYHDLPPGSFDKFKNEPNVYVAVGYKNMPNALVGEEYDPDASSMWSPITEMTMRVAGQRFGTEAGRDVYGYNHWLDMCLPNPEHLTVPESWHVGRKMCITDVRFENEHQRIAELGGINVRIETSSLARQNRGADTSKDNHPSELLPGLHLVDYVIENSGSVAQLYKQIEQVLSTQHWGANAT